MSFEYQFPDPRTAEPDGLLAVGGDLSLPSILTAYSHGIFPWYNEHSPILWWSPDPRLVLFPEKFKLSSSLKQRLNSGSYTIKIDHDFEQVIHHCAAIKRQGQDGTWITDEMIKAYTALFDEGYVHSFETWYNDELVGGLYGLSLGKAFFGESMFYTMRDASKIAFHALIEWAEKNEFLFIDAQQSTSHLKSLGAEEISRNDFLELLKSALKSETIRGNWGSISSGAKLK